MIKSPSAATEGRAGERLYHFTMKEVRGQVEGMKWTKDAIEEELRMYREMRCRAEELRLDLEAYEDLESIGREGMIEAGTFQRPKEPDMPRGSTAPDPTGRLALIIPDEAKASACKIELRRVQRRVRRVEAWLAALPNRERRVLDLFYVKGMTWEETLWAYNHTLQDGGRSRNALRRMRDSAIERIASIAKSKMGTTGDGNGTVSGT